MVRVFGWWSWGPAFESVWCTFFRSSFRDLFFWKILSLALMIGVTGYDLFTARSARHVFPPKYEAWTHFNRPWTEYQCQGVVWRLLIIFTESVNRSTCLSVYLITTRLRNVNLLCFSDSIEGIEGVDFLNCTLKCLSKSLFLLTVGLLCFQAKKLPFSHGNGHSDWSTEWLFLYNYRLIYRLANTKDLRFST